MGGSAICYTGRVNIISKSPLHYFQAKGRGRPGAADAASPCHADPFRLGQVALFPRFSSGTTRSERRISKPDPVHANLRNLY